MKTGSMTTAAKIVAAFCVIVATNCASSVNAKTYVVKNGSILNATFTVDDNTMLINAISGEFRGSSISGIVVNPYAPSVGYYSLPTQTVQASRPSGSYYSFDNIFNGSTFPGDGLLFKTSMDVTNIYAVNGNIFVDYAPFGTTSFNAVSGTTTVTPQAAAPEPATWALMILGFGITGVALRRRRYRISYNNGTALAV